MLTTSASVSAPSPDQLQRTGAALTSCQGMNIQVEVAPSPTSPVNAPVLSLKSEAESPSSRRIPGPSHHRHVRTIKEVRTTITRIITDVYYEDGKEVERKVSEVADAHTQL